MFSITDDVEEHEISASLSSLASGGSVIPGNISLTVSHKK
jgi:hypothetical protein